MSGQRSSTDKLDTENSIEIKGHNRNFTETHLQVKNKPVIVCLLEAITELLEYSICIDKATGGQPVQEPDDALAYLSLSNLQKLFEIST